MGLPFIVGDVAAWFRVIFLLFMAALISGLGLLTGLAARRRLRRLQLLGDKEAFAAVRFLPFEFAAGGAVLGVTVPLADLAFEWGGNKLIAWDTPAGAAENVGYFLGCTLVVAIIGLGIGFVSKWSLRRRLQKTGHVVPSQAPTLNQCTDHQLTSLPFRRRMHQQRWLSRIRPLPVSRKCDLTPGPTISSLATGGVSSRCRYRIGFSGSS